MSRIAKHLCAFSFVLLTAGLACGEVRGQQPSASGMENAKEHISQLEHRWMDALNNDDLEAVGHILADDFQRPSPQSGGFLSKPQLLSWYKAHLSKTSPVKRRIQELTITIYAQTAIARGSVVITNPAEKKQTTDLFTDVFVLRGGEWKAVSAQENAVGH